MRAILLGVAFIVSMMAIGGVHAAVTWSDVDCAEADLALSDGFRCRRSTDVSTGTSTYRQHFSAVIGSVAGLNVNATLWVLSSGVYSAYSADASEKVIRAFANASTPTPDDWGHYKGFGGTGYMTFKRKGRGCVGFDHAGPSASSWGAAGYPYLLRGFFCDENGVTNAEARLREVLAAFRIGGPGGGKNAFGEPVVALAGAPRPASPPPTQAAAPAPAHATPSSRSVPVAVTWEGVSNLALGTMRYTGKDSGDIMLDLAEGGRKCVGTWRLLASQGAAPQTGTWAISCPNGQAASGTYRATEAGKGAGEGIDAQGRKIAIRYGGSR